MTPQQLFNNNIYLESLQDVVFPASPGQTTSVRVEYLGSTIFSGIYYGDANNEIHLDLRDIATNLTSWHLPSSEKFFTPNEDATVSLSIAYREGNSNEVSGQFTVYGFPSDLLERMTDIDYLRVPEDFSIPATLAAYNYAWGTTRHTITVHLHDHRKVAQAGIYTYGDVNGSLLSGVFPIKDLPVSIDSPFFLSFVTSDIDENVSSEIRTPTMKVQKGRKFEQFAFLNKYGHYDFVPMDGAVQYAPEFNIEAADRDGARTRVLATKRDVFIQNSGYMTRRTIIALGELLTSRAIWHMNDEGEWEPIVIENPNVATSSKDNLHSISFSWSHENGHTE